jgi:hypothetical protein
MNVLSRAEISEINKRAHALSAELREIIREDLARVVINSKSHPAPMTLLDIKCHIPPTVSAVRDCNGLPL